MKEKTGQSEPPSDSGETQQNGEPSSSLSRELGRTAATLFCAAMIIGTGLFGALGDATEKAGSGILWAIMPGLVVALATGLSAAQLGVVFPQIGGGFIWARKLNHKTLSFVAGCCYLGQGVVGISVVALAFATYSAQIVQGLPLHITAAVLVLVITIVNSFGLKFTSKLVIGLMLTVVALLAIYVIFSVHKINASNLSDLSGNGFGGIMAGAAIFFWAWDGFIRTAIMAGEIKNPRQTIPFSIIGGIIIAAIVYFIVVLVTLGVLGAQQIPKDDAPLFRAAVQAVGTWGGWIILAAAWTAAISETAGDMLPVSRVAVAMGQERELPAWFGDVDEKYKVPRHAVWVLGAAVFVVVLFFDLRQILPLASMFLLIWFSIIHYSALQLKKEQHFVTPLVSWFGLLSCLVVFVSLPIGIIIIGLVTLILALGLRRVLNRSV